MLWEYFLSKISPLLSLNFLLVTGILGDTYYRTSRRIFEIILTFRTNFRRTFGKVIIRVSHSFENLDPVSEFLQEWTRLLIHYNFLLWLRASAFFDSSMRPASCDYQPKLALISTDY